MGLFDKIRDAFDSPDDTAEDALNTSTKADVGVSFDMEPPKDTIDLDDLKASIIEYHRASEADADVISSKIEEGYSEGYGYDKIVRNAQDEGLSIDRDETHTIVWTEFAGIQMRRNAGDAHEQVVKSDFVRGVEWSVPDDDRGCSDVCEATADEISNRGGAVSVPELQSILRSKAKQYDDGMPERVDDWIPTKECRCTIITVFD